MAQMRAELMAAATSQFEVESGQDVALDSGGETQRVSESGRQVCEGGAESIEAYSQEAQRARGDPGHACAMCLG